MSTSGTEWKAGDFIELANGKTVRLTAETAAIANAAADKERDEDG